MEGISKYIPRCMSTQHPDHANNRHFSKNYKIRIADEITEAHYVFNNETGLGCDEVMLDLDGKSACNRMVAELFSRYGEFFKKNIVGEGYIHNHQDTESGIERGRGKNHPEILGATEIITMLPRHSMAMTHRRRYLSHIADDDVCRKPEHIYHYYKDVIVGRQDLKLLGSGKSISELFGDFEPDRINVIPLFEDMEHLLNAHNITQSYIEDKELEHQRVFSCEIRSGSELWACKRCSFKQNST